jgi:hypothetical protein
MTEKQQKREEREDQGIYGYKKSGVKKSCY